jgi:molybdenum cofactor guanylyltransferase
MADTTLAILAGGRGSRMGGTKDQLRIAGRPALLHLLDRLAFAGPTILVTSPAHPTPLGHERFDQVVVDQLTGVGPLAGIVAALRAASTPLVCFLTVDMPNVGPEQVRWLVDVHGNLPDAAGILCRWRHMNEPSLESFPNLIRSRAASAVSDHIAAGRYSVRSLLSIPGFVALGTPVNWPASVWLNLNEPRDLPEAGATFP